MLIVHLSSRIVIPLANPDPSVYKWPIPKYLVRVTIIQAEDLINADDGLFHYLINNKSDPYVKLQMNGQRNGFPFSRNDY